MSRGFEMNENIGVKPPFQWEWTTVQYRMTLVQNHITRLHRNIISLSIMSINLNRPRLIHILRHIQNGRTHKRHAIDVSGQDGSFRVDANAVEAAFRDLVARPFFHGAFGGIPDFAFDVGSCSAEAGVFDAYHVGW